ncbi:MAG TPA: UvrY/SirA/GacA family response regulator transcription factor [Gammaproteobacteria bacterium]|nr:UvrY/SirA/GacA family response regulator transcription factor [Gammaproteobacteria bacterium]
MIRVLLVDDHKLVRTGIRRLLADSADIEVVAEAESGEQAITLARSHRPQVVLMDVSMPGIGGLEATRKLLHQDPEIRIIALSVHTDDPYPSRLLEAGAAGYLTKDCEAEEIITAIKRVSRGDVYIDADVARNLALSSLPGHGGGNNFQKLSQREMQIMLMVVQGHTIQEISDRLFISPKTVSTYRYRLFEKLGVANDVELTHLAIRHGIVGDADNRR